MLAADGINAKVINIHTIKPLDEELVVASAKECKKVVTVEEHSIIGGLGSAVCDTLCANYPTPVLKIGVNDVYGESGPAVRSGCREHLQESKSFSCVNSLNKRKKTKTTFRYGFAIWKVVFIFLFFGLSV